VHAQTVQVSALTVLDIWQKLALGYAVALQFVGGENARHVLQPLQETLEEARFAAQALRRVCTRTSSTMPS
jgi:hypothetical protein